MPYIDKIDRARLMEDDAQPRNAGELNYVITKHAVELLMPPPQPIAASVSGREAGLGFFESAVGVEVDKFLAYKAERGNQHQRGRNNYQDYNDVMGVLACARREFERRLWTMGLPTDALNILDEYATRFYHERVAPYEDIKIQQNGDVI